MRNSTVSRLFSRRSMISNLLKNCPLPEAFSRSNEACYGARQQTFSRNNDNVLYIYSKQSTTAGRQSTKHFHKGYVLHYVAFAELSNAKLFVDHDHFFFFFLCRHFSLSFFDITFGAHQAYAQIHRHTRTHAHIHTENVLFRNRII